MRTTSEERITDENGLRTPEGFPALIVIGAHASASLGSLKVSGGGATIVAEHGSLKGDDIELGLGYIGAPWSTLKATGELKAMNVYCYQYAAIEADMVF